MINRPNITVVAGENSVRLEHKNHFAMFVKVFIGDKLIFEETFNNEKAAVEAFEKQHALYIKNAEAKDTQIDHLDGMTDKECENGSCPIR